VALLVLLALVVIAGALLYALRPSAHPTTPRAAAPDPIIPALDRMDCPRDLAWSPDRTRIAVLGYVGDCPSLTGPSGGNLGGNRSADPHTAGLVNIYAVSSGKLLDQLTPDTNVVPAVAIPSAVTVYDQQTATNQTTDVFDINYTHVLWTHDGQRLILTFDLYLPTGIPVAPANQPPYWPGIEVDGVVTLPLAGVGAPQVLLHQQAPGAVPALVEWDLSAGQALPVPADLSATPSPLESLAPALTYQWGQNGQLTPVTPLDATHTPSPAPPSAVGDPNGGAAFSIWQPGIASDQVPLAPGTAGAPLANAFTWSTDIAALSPDGRYLVERADINGLLAAAQPSLPASDQLAAYPGWASAPLLPVRDAGLGQAYALSQHNGVTSPLLYATAPIGPNGADSQGTQGATPRGVLVAWRPDGKVVAVDAAFPDHSVKLYDCASGRLLASLVPLMQTAARNTPHEQGEMNVLRWSPDGTQLALFDTVLGRVTIWSGAALPH
jgi:hypothetical protein